MGFIRNKKRELALEEENKQLKERIEYLEKLNSLLEYAINRNSTSISLDVMNKIQELKSSNNSK